jgi:hypothetical protein
LRVNVIFMQLEIDGFLASEFRQIDCLATYALRVLMKTNIRFKLIIVVHIEWVIFDVLQLTLFRDKKKHVKSGLTLQFQ